MDPFVWSRSSGTLPHARTLMGKAKVKKFDKTQKLYAPLKFQEARDIIPHVVMICPMPYISCSIRCAVRGPQHASKGFKRD